MELPFVGQHDQLEQLGAILTNFPEQSGRVVLVGGEAGAGKSTLLKHARQATHEYHSIWAVGHCDRLKQTPPYGPWIEAISKLGLEPLTLAPPFGSAAGDWRPRSMAYALVQAAATSPLPVRLVLEHPLGRPDHVRITACVNVCNTSMSCGGTCHV